MKDETEEAGRAAASTATSTPWTAADCEVAADESADDHDVGILSRPPQAV